MYWYNWLAIWKVINLYTVNQNKSKQEQTATCHKGKKKEKKP